MKLLIIPMVLTCSLFVFATYAHADRGPAPVIKPLVHKGLKFIVPNTVESMGVVQAWDVATGKKVWEKKVYTVKLDPAEETDVQWRFISKLSWKGEKLHVINESKETFEVEVPKELFKR